MNPDKFDEIIKTVNACYRIKHLKALRQGRTTSDSETDKEIVLTVDSKTYLQFSSGKS